MNLEEAAAKYRVRGIPANMIDRFWSLAEPYVKRGLDHTRGEYTADDVRAYCKDRILQLWLVSEGERVVAAATTEIIIYPRMKHCRVATLGGSKAVEWLELLLETIAAWGKEQGCESMEAFVRRGFVPILTKEPHNWKHMYSAVFKPIG